MKYFKLFVSFITVALLMTACAQMKPPTGGDRDVEPPVLLKSTPENFSTDFTATRIILEFDEFIQLRNIGTQLVINPAMEKRPSFRMKGKRLFIDLNSPLQDETTYVINFGDAVVDLTEGNKLSGLQYVFSTGSYLDSLQVRGLAIDAFDQTPANDVLVVLYSNFTDTTLTKGRPDYFTKTSKNGEFEINFIRPGTYHLYAIGDENSNYQYNAPAEMIGFIDSEIIPGPPDTTNIQQQLYLFHEEDTTQYIDERKEMHYGQLQLYFHRPADSVQLRPLDDEYNIIFEQGTVGDTVTAWFPNRKSFPELENIRVLVSDQSGFQDTLRWNLIKRRNDADPQLTINDNLLFNFNPYRPMRFELNHPATLVDTSRISLFRDSVEVDFNWSSTSIRKFELHHPWEPGETYEVIIPDSTFFDVFEMTNDTLKKSVRMREERYFGNLQFDLRYDERQNIILQLLSDRGEVIKEVQPKTSGVITFNRMDPATYSMRVIYDLNGNGKWDTGSVAESRQPEPVVVYTNSIQIRSNWDMELTWDLTGD